MIEEHEASVKAFKRAVHDRQGAPAALCLSYLTLCVHQAAQTHTVVRRRLRGAGPGGPAGGQRAGGLLLPGERPWGYEGCCPCFLSSWDALGGGYLLNLFTDRATLRCCSGEAARARERAAPQGQGGHRHEGEDGSGSAASQLSPG